MRIEFKINSHELFLYIVIRFYDDVIKFHILSIDLYSSICEQNELACAGKCCRATTALRNSPLEAQVGNQRFQEEICVYIYIYMYHDMKIVYFVEALLVKIDDFLQQKDCKCH